MKRTFIIIILLVLSVSVVKSQFMDDYFVGLGISTTKLIGDNPNTYAFINPNTDIFGGSFNEWQSGVDLRLLLNANDAQTLRIPIGIDYAIFNSYERWPLVGRSDVFTHSLNMMSIYMGINYAFIKFPIADAKLYASLEPRFSLIHMLSFEQSIDYQDPSRNDRIEEFPTKDNAFRIGGVFKIGVEGKLKNNLYVNASFGVSSINLLLRDDERGELFTPDRKGQDSEQIVGAMNVTVMLQYKFN